MTVRVFKGETDGLPDAAVHGRRVGGAVALGAVARVAGEAPVPGRARQVLVRRAGHATALHRQGHGQLAPLDEAPPFLLVENDTVKRDTHRGVASDLLPFAASKSQRGPLQCTMRLF